MLIDDTISLAVQEGGTISKEPDFGTTRDHMTNGSNSADSHGWYTLTFGFTAILNK